MKFLHPRRIRWSAVLLSLALLVSAFIVPMTPVSEVRGEAQEVTEDVSLDGDAVLPEYTVFFQSTGTPNDGSFIELQKIPPGTTLGDVALYGTPLRKHCEFLGWGTVAEDVSSLLSDDYVFAGDMHLYALFGAPECSVLFESTGTVYDGAFVNLKKLPVGTKLGDVTLSQTPMRRYCEFLGWGTAAEDVSSLLSDDHVFTGDVNLYALFAANATVPAETTGQDSGSNETTSATNPGATDVTTDGTTGVSSETTESTADATTGTAAVTTSRKSVDNSGVTKTGESGGEFLYYAIGAAALCVLVILFLLIKRRKNKKDEDEEEDS